MTRNNKIIKSVFVKNKNIEYPLIMGAAMAVLLFIDTLGEIKFHYAVLPCVSFVFVMNILMSIGRKRKVIDHLSQEVLFAESLQILIGELYSNGFKLKEKIGDFYIFTNSFLYFVNREVVVREKSGQCFLQSNQIIIEQLSEVIDFKKSPNKSKVEANNSNDDRD